MTVDPTDLNADFDLMELDDSMMYPSGHATWTSRDARDHARGLARRAKESTFRQLIDGERAWNDELDRAKNDYVQKKVRERYANYTRRLDSAGILRLSVVSHQSGSEMHSLFGYRVDFDERDVVTELAKTNLPWDIRPEGRPHTIGPIFLPGGVFTLRDGLVVVRAKAWIDGPGHLGVPAEDCSSEWFGRRAFAGVRPAFQWAISAIQRGNDAVASAKESNP